MFQVSRPKSKQPTNYEKYKKINTIDNPSGFDSKSGFINQNIDF